MTDRKPTIAILTNYPLDHASFTGGVETATAGLLEGLGKYAEEIDIHVVTLARGIDREKIERRNGISFHFGPIYDHWYSRPHFFSNVLCARSILLRLSADLVHCQDNMGLAVAALTAGCRKRIFTVHGVKSVEASVWKGPEYWSHKFDALLESVIRRRYNDVIAVSPYVHQFLHRGVRIHDVANPVGRIFFETSHMDASASSVLFVGSLTRLKRPFDLIKAFAQVVQLKRDASLCLVGPVEDRKYQKEMESYIQKKKLSKVSFRGSLSQTEVAQLMAGSTVLVLPSVHENTPMVIAEAMAVGLPVVASAVGGIPMMIDDDVTGFLFEAGNIETLAQTLNRVLSDEALRLRVSRNARHMASSLYSPEAVADATMSIYREKLSE